MNRGMYSQLGEATGPPSSDDEDDDEGEARRGAAGPAGGPRSRSATAAPTRGSGVILLESTAVPTPAAETGDANIDASQEGEGVFEIRDFTAASTFERLVHQISLAVKRWNDSLAKEALTEAVCLREEFDHAALQYELLFQYSPVDCPSPSASSAPLYMPPSPSSPSKPARVAPPERLGLHSFPARAHRIQRWFGVQHFVMLSVREQNIDVDSARTMLSALVLAAKSAKPPRAHPLSCFVPVDGGRRRRFIGECVNSGWRTVYTTDANPTVDPSLEHLAGMLEFFWQKLGADPEEPAQTLTLGARFTYLVELFEPLPADGGVHGSSSSLACAAGQVFQPPSRSSPSAEQNLEDASRSGPPPPPKDPVESLQLHVLWPSFPRGSFVDDAVYSELEPRAAPYWKLRVLRKDAPELPKTQRLRNLLEFRKEARTVRSAEHSVQPQMPKTAFAALSYTIQESLESLLLPTHGEMMDLTADCLSFPICAPEEAIAATSPPVTSLLQGAARGSRLARLAELGADMKCFKGAVMLWCQVLTEMRRQWDNLEDVVPEGAASPPTRRCPGSGVRSEQFSASNCLVQQKFEMLQRSVEARLGKSSGTATPATTRLRIKSTGEALLGPALVPPALLTEDMVMQRNLAAANITDLIERAQFACGREVHFDAAVFKAANPRAGFEDFLAWRTEVEGLDSKTFANEWFAKCWAEAEACHASKQAGKLFEPEREAEMCLHYLENIEGTQLLMQLFRVSLATAIEDLNDHQTGGASSHFRILRERAKAAATAALGPGKVASDAAAAVVGEPVDFPEEDLLEAVLTAVEALETAVRLGGSLRLKLPGTAAALVEELLVEGEATVTSFEDRKVIEELFENGRTLSRARGRETFDGKSIFECLPLCKEFIILLQPVATPSSPSTPSLPAEDAVSSCGVRRMYAEIRQSHLRLAIGNSFRLI